MVWKLKLALKGYDSTEAAVTIGPPAVRSEIQDNKWKR